MTTNNTTTTPTYPAYEADQDLIDNAMLEMDNSILLKNFGALIKAELQTLNMQNCSMNTAIGTYPIGSAKTT